MTSLKTMRMAMTTTKRVMLAVCCEVEPKILPNDDDQPAAAAAQQRDARALALDASESLCGVVAEVSLSLLLLALL